MAEAALARLADDESPPALRAMAVQLLPATQPRLTVDLLSRLVAQDDPRLRLEATRALCEHPSPRRFAVLLESARDERMGIAVRAQAIVGLAEHAEARDDLLRMAQGEDEVLRDEALRALSRSPLTAEQRMALEPLAGRSPGSAPLVARVLEQPFVRDRPPAEDLDAWLARLEGPADPEAGRRVFFHPRLAGCFRCHRAEGRGRDVGPDLSVAGRNGRRRLVESIVQPSNEVGPSYQNWQVATNDGRVRSGILVRTNLDETTYLDATGALFTVATPDVDERRPLPSSIMPAGLTDLMTDHELRDLVAYLESLR
jgi:putative heme-binding domain-containing protein